MSRTRTLSLAIALAALLGPAVGRAQDREWVEDYTDEWNDSRPQDGYDVDVDLDVSGSISFDTFHGPLAAYGDWVVVGGYGRVWRPHVAAGWRPYYYGRWDWTNEGWFWVSDEPWGWAAYHYGRWAFDPGFGWFWVPGYQWAPAWVSWRYSGDVIGWAPLAPGLSIYVTSYPFYEPCWTFVPTVRFVSVPVYSVAYAPSYTRRYFHVTSPAPPPRSARPAPMPGGRVAPAPAWGGPAPRVIEQRTGHRIVPARVVPAASPDARGRAGEIPVYRPEARPAARPGGVAGPGRGGGRGRPDTAPGRVGTPGRGGERAPAPTVDRPGRDDGPGWSRPHGGEGTPPRATPRGGSDRGEARPAPQRGESRYENRGPAPRSDRGDRGGWSAPRGDSGAGGGWSAPRGQSGGGGRSEGAPAPRPSSGGGGERRSDRPHRR